MDRKEKIRARYRHRNDKVQKIPAKTIAGIYDDNDTKRVAVYARVSTDSEDQTSSYELQKNYYEEMVRKHPNWILVDIYADEGISGTSLKHRDELIRMIEDCKKGIVDLIITKNVPRFARNVEDCIHYSRLLRLQDHKVGILFETENIYTLNPDSEMSLSFIATMAQEESHSKSESMKRSYHMRFERGIFLTPALLGYDNDEDRSLAINEDEARTVRVIFLMYLVGYNCSEIAIYLMTLKRHTKVKRRDRRINWKWSGSSVYNILRNERYCGDVLAQKTFTPNYLDHKSVRNHMDLPQYYEADHHEAIIPRNMYMSVQRMLDQQKYGFKNAVPELKVIDSGVLKGFVQINPCWMGFDEIDYLDTCHKVLSDEDYLNPLVSVYKVKGNYDLREYQVTRGQFIPTTNKVAVNVTNKYIRFTNMAIQELQAQQYVELLYHPLYEILVVRPGVKGDKHAVKWSELKNGRYRAKRIKGDAFMPVLYKLCGWNRECKYTISGYVKEQHGEKIIMFYMDEPEIRMVDGDKQMIAYPKTWQGEFGDYYLEHTARTQSIFDPGIEWNIGNRGRTIKRMEYETYNLFDCKTQLRELVNELKEECDQICV